MSRTEFSSATKRAAWDRAGGCCECGCGRLFTDHPTERPHYDHELSDALGGDISLKNCRVIRVDCHQAKTSGEDMPRIAKAKRGERKRPNIEALRRKLPGHRGDKWKMKVGGGTVLRGED